MAPVMTTRYKSKPNDSSPWKYEANNRLNAYFGGPNSIAMIGQNEFQSTDDRGKLLIKLDNADTDYNFLAFKRGDNKLGRLFMNNDGGLMLGSTTGRLGNNANSVGRSSEASGTNATAFGSVAKADKEAATAIGSSVTASGVSSLAVGTSSNATADNSIAIGNAANGSGASAVAIGQSLTGSGANSIAIGQSLTASGANVIAIGNTFTAASDNSIGIGAGADPDAADTIAIGRGAKITQARNSKSVDAQGAIAIGATSNAKYDNSIAIGNGAKSGSYVVSDTANLRGGSVAIGYSANANGSKSVAIGESSTAFGSYSVSIGDNAISKIYATVAIGKDASAERHNGIAIGEYSTTNALSGIAIGKEANAKLNGENLDGASAIAIGREANAETTAEKKSPNGYTTHHTYTSSIAIGSEANATNGGIAIGMSNKYMIISPSSGLYTTTETKTEATNLGVAIGANAKANSGIALGNNACSEVTGSNKICIGANSGPIAGTDWASDNQERIFIGSKSKFNNGAAVLEVHNTNNERIVNHNQTKAYDTAVVINGSLIVKGGIYAPVHVLGTKSQNPTGSASIGLINGNFQGDAHWSLSAGNNSHNGDTDLDMYYGAYGRYKSINGMGDVTWRVSDRRLKYVGKENKSGLDKIRQLKVFNYTFKKDTTKTPHVGVIAQDLQKVFPNAVKKGADGFLTIRMEDMFYAVINAIKELDAKYQAQEKRINELEKRIEKLEAKVK